jgi:cytochrome c oxidase subunit II
MEAVGAQWTWSFRLPGVDKQFGSTDVSNIDARNPLGINSVDPRGRDDLIITNGEVHVPLGRPVKVMLRSIDVLHDFYIPQIRAKMDLVPGMETYFWFVPEKTGQFEILCVAYCGLGHPQMRGFLSVDSERDYQSWLSVQQSFAQSRGESYQDIRAVDYR